MRLMMQKFPKRWSNFLVQNSNSRTAKKFLLYGGKIFYLMPGIYESNYDSFFFSKNIIYNENERVLDLGTGTGILAITCTDFSRNVVGTDILKKSIECARINAKLNGVEKKVIFKQGSFFEPVKNQKFDLILTDSPQQPNPHKVKFSSIVSTAIDAGPDGRECIDKIILESQNHLCDGGRIQIYHGQFANIKKSMELAKEVGLKPKITAKGEGSFGRTSGERIAYFESIGIKIKRKKGIPVLEYYILTLYK